MLALGLHEGARVKHLGIFDNSAHDKARQAFAIAHHRIFHIGGDILEEVQSLIDILELIEQSVNLLAQRTLLAARGDDLLYHLFVADYHTVELRLISNVATRGHHCRTNQLVGNAAQCRHHHDDRFLLGLNNLLYLLYTIYGTHRCSAKFHYLHRFHFIE